VWLGKFIDFLNGFQRFSPSLPQPFPIYTDLRL